jgi:tetratricopeptide (TPR) repeat protein
MNSKSKKGKKSLSDNSESVLSASRFLLYSSLVIAVITGAIYFKSLNNQLTQWDDDIYVSNNPDITTLKSDVGLTLKNTFTSYVNGNYHPVTMLSYCIEYYFFGISTKAFHTTNLIIHILNSLLVLAFVWLLVRQQWVACITALLFAIHPMHVESVVWVSERKDLLYTLFYLGALCTYVVYIQNDKHKKYYYITFVLFVVSCLSKGMAVSLPLVLFLIDYFKGRSFSRNTILEKVPFLIISLVLGIVAIKAQASIGAVGDLKEYNFFDRILFSCYGLMMYLWKLFIPVQNSCFYNYPETNNDSYPTIIYLSPIILSAIIFILWKLSKSYKKEFLFASAFFIVTIALVLQLLPVGSAIIAERYTYIPYIGAFFLMATVFNNVLIYNPEAKNIFIGVLIFVSTTLSYLSYKATLLWKDGVTLLEHAAKNDKYPICVLHYKNLAIAHFYQGNYNEAEKYYTNAINKAENKTELICDRGVTYYRMGKYNNAIEDLSSVIKQDTKHLNARHYRGLSYFNSNQYKNAINDLTVAIELNPVFTEHYYYRGLSNYILGNYKEALVDYDYMVYKNMVSSDVYNNRGLILLKMQQYSKALLDFSKALEYDDKNANAYFNKGLAFQNLGQNENALEQYSIALKYNPNYGYTYLNRSQVLFRLKRYAPALQDALRAQEMGMHVENSFIETLRKGS